MRAQRSFSVAESKRIGLCNHRSRGERTSIRVWCSHVSAPPAYGNQVRTHCQVTTAPEKKRKKAKKPLIGVVCLLTTGGLISVRPGRAPEPRLHRPGLATPWHATTLAHPPTPGRRAGWLRLTGWARARRVRVRCLGCLGLLSSCLLSWCSVSWLSLSWGGV